MRFWNQIRLTKMFIQLVGNPNRTDLIFKTVDIVCEDRNQKPVEAMEALVLGDASFRRMFEENYMPENPRLEDLARLPEDTFGYRLYQHMHEHGLDFDIFPPLRSRRAIHYLSTRIYRDHDLWHVLLGRGVEVEDELAVQAFGVAQFASPVGTLIIAGGLLHLLGKDPLRAVSAFRMINEAYLMGRGAPFLLGVPIHELLSRKLTDVRASLNLQVRPTFTVPTRRECTSGNAFPLS